MSAPTQTNGSSLSYHLQEIQAQHQELEQTIRQLRQQVAALEAECAVVQRERDSYRKQFHFLADKYLPEAPPEYALTEEQMDERKASGVDLPDLIRELEQVSGQER